MKKNNGYNFRLNVETNNRTGDVMAVYFKVRDGVSHSVKEYEEGNVFADYDRSGKLLGFEMLAPCEARVLDKIAGEASVKKFVRGNIPNAMLCVS